VNEITSHLRRHFRVTKGPWAIGGLSMGGYGSLKLGLKHPERLASVYAHSSKLQTPDTGIDLSLLEDPEDIDLLSHARRVAAAGRRPVVSFDCGVADEGIIDEKRWFHAELDRLGLQHS
jgi:putative tributyrin esterase